MISKTNQRLVTGGLVGAAFAALVFGALYQDDRPIDETQVIGNDQAPPGANGGAAATGGAATTAAPSSPIEGFFPASGQASACREPVGVDLIPGYAATLTINGVAIPPERMNVVLDADGEITDQISASRSLSQYTYGPEENCPNGEIIRATDNVLQVCVYRLEDGPAGCAISEIRFDVL
ncbi:MAG: hypothetical protein ACFCVK_06055 [Acidimicrobiales bacterium]